MTTNTGNRSKVTLSNSMRVLIVKKYDSGKSFMQISMDLDVNCNTVRSVINKYKNTGNICNEKKKCGRKKKINSTVQALIRDELQKDCSITLRAIQKTISNDSNLDVSVSTIHRSIESFQYSFKRVQLIPVRRNFQSNILNRFNYARKLIEEDFERLIFVDEMGVNCAMRKRHGRALIGVTPRKSVTTIRSKNISIAAAITQNELLLYKINESPYNKISFTAFMQDIMNTLRSKTVENMIVICDNVPFHKAETVKEMCSNFNHTLLFLPPYSPQLNPIEEAFSVWKDVIRGANCQSKDELMDQIQWGSASFTTVKCQGFFRNMNRFLVKALAREDF